MMLSPKTQSPHAINFWRVGFAKPDLDCRYATLSPAPEGAIPQHMQQQHMQATIGRD
jgi:hypothetical protein